MSPPTPWTRTVQRRGLELRECGRDGRVAAGVVDAVAAHQADAGAVLVGQHAVAVDLLLVDPAGPVKGARGRASGPLECTGGSPSLVYRPYRTADARVIA